MHETQNYFQRHQDNIILFRLTIGFWVVCIIVGLATSLYFYNAIGNRKRQDRETIFSNCIEQDSPDRSSSPLPQSGIRTLKTESIVR